MASHCLESRTSVGWTAARRPRASMSAAVRSICSLVRAAQTMSAPASARARAIWRPRPRPAPVTTATLPSRRKRSRVVMGGVYLLTGGGTKEDGGGRMGTMLDVGCWIGRVSVRGATFDVRVACGVRGDDRWNIGAALVVEQGSGAARRLGRL